MPRFCRVAFTYTPEASRPYSPEMVYQKAAPIWLPFSVVSHMLFISLVGMHIRIGRFGGELAYISLVSHLFLPCGHTGAGHACGPGGVFCGLQTYNLTHLRIWWWCVLWKRMGAGWSVFVGDRESCQRRVRLTAEVPVSAVRQRRLQCFGQKSTRPSDSNPQCTLT